jgi:hypothetical protein
MFLDLNRRRIPTLVEQSIAGNQAGKPPPNTHVVDLDAPKSNSRHIWRVASKLSPNVYAMTKQIGRNGSVCNAIARGGIVKAVAADMECVRATHRAELSIGHIGHLVQVPRFEVAGAASLSHVIGNPPDADWVKSTWPQSGHIDNAEETYGDRLITNATQHYRFSQVRLRKCTDRGFGERCGFAIVNLPLAFHRPNILFAVDAEENRSRGVGSRSEAGSADADGSNDTPNEPFLDSIQEVTSEELQAVEMEFEQGRRIAVACGSQQLLPERWVFLPPRPQVVIMSCGDPLDFSRPERGDDTNHAGAEPQRLGGNPRIRACRVPRQSQCLGTQLPRRFGRKDPQIRTLSIGRSITITIPNLTPPLPILEPHVDEKKWTLGRPAPCRLIQLEPKPLPDSHHLRRVALGKSAAPFGDKLPEHLQATLVQCIDEVQRLRAGPFPSRQGSGRVRCIGSHAFIVRGKAPDLLHSLGVFVSKTKLSQRMNAPWKIGSDVN